MIDGAVVVSASPSLGATPGRQGLAAQRFVKSGEFSSSLLPRAPSPERSLGPPQPSGVPAEETHLEGGQGEGDGRPQGQGAEPLPPLPLPGLAERARVCSDKQHVNGAPGLGEAPGRMPTRVTHQKRGRRTLGAGGAGSRSPRLQSGRSLRPVLSASVAASWAPRPRAGRSECSRSAEPAARTPAKAAPGGAPRVPRCSLRGSQPGASANRPRAPGSAAAALRRRER